MAGERGEVRYRPTWPSAGCSVLRYEPADGALALHQVRRGDPLHVVCCDLLKRLGKTLPGCGISRHQVHEAQREALIRHALQRVDDLRVQLTLRARELLLGYPVTLDVFELAENGRFRSRRL